MRYWLSRSEGEVAGPFTADELRAMMARGEIGQGAQLCPEGTQEWMPLEQVAEVFGGAGGGAPSTWPLAGPPGSDPLSMRPFGFSEAAAIGWESFKARYGLLLGATLIVFAASLASSVIVSLIDFAAQNAGSQGLRAALMVLAMSFNIATSFLVNLPLSIGLIWIAVRIARAEPCDIGTLFAPFGHLLMVIGTALLVSVAILAVVIAPIAIAVATLVASTGGGMQTSPGAIAILVFVVCMVVAVAGSLFMTTRLMPAYLLVVDPKAGPLGPVGAFRTAWAMTSGRFWTLLGLLLVFGLIAGISLLACLLPGLFFGYPLLAAVFGATYALLFAKTRG